MRERLHDAPGVGQILRHAMDGAPRALAGEERGLPVEDSGRIHLDRDEVLRQIEPVGTAVVARAEHGIRFGAAGIAGGKATDGGAPSVVVVVTETGGGIQVGVAGDVRTQGLETGPGLIFYTPYPQYAWPNMSVTIRASGDPRLLLRDVRAQLLTLDRDLPAINPRTLDDVVDEVLAPRRQTMLLVAAFAALASAAQAAELRPLSTGTLRGIAFGHGASSTLVLWAGSGAPRLQRPVPKATATDASGHDLSWPKTGLAVGAAPVLVRVGTPLADALQIVHAGKESS